MSLRLVILPLLLTLSMGGTIKIAYAQDSAITRCAYLRLDQKQAELIGHTLKRIKQREIDIGDGPVVVQPVMAGMKGPSITLLGRDVRLAVTTQQTSPQELWHKSSWNRDHLDNCAQPKTSWKKSILRGLYWKGALDNTIGFTTYQPKILYRTRVVGDTLLVRPFGFAFGASLSVPISTNTEALLGLPDNRQPVRRDLARFANGFGVERLYASWRTTPITDVHISLNAGYLEEMYGGAGAEIIYRPFGSPFWAGADGWKLWRRDPFTNLNLRWSDETLFSGHIRAGYDVPDSRMTFSVAAGKYLAGDTGATFAWRQGFENGARLEAALTWTNRSEDEGFFRDTHFDPSIRAVWPLGANGRTESRLQVRQVGRDGGQMLDRPLPLEQLTETFSTRETVRHWPQMFD